MNKQKFVLNKWVGLMLKVFLFCIFVLFSFVYFVILGTTLSFVTLPLLVILFFIYLLKWEKKYLFIILRIFLLYFLFYLVLQITPKHTCTSFTKIEMPGIQNLSCKCLGVKMIDIKKLDTMCIGKIYGWK